MVTNVDPDHLSNWGTAENYADGFLAFVTGDDVRLVVVSADDPGAAALTARLRERSRGPEIVTFGVAETADVRISEVTLAGSGSEFALHRNGRGGGVSWGCPATTTCSTPPRRTR